MNNKIKAIDLFCGGGGFSRGLLDAGLEVVLAVDNWNAAVSFYKRNLPGHPVENFDLLDIDSSITRLREYEFNLIVGGPPCQDFSSAGKRDENGDRANLTTAFARIVSNLKPKYFAMENVDRARKTRTFARSLDIFRDAGYGLTVHVLDASLCGVPQKRKRVVVWGVLGGNNNELSSIIQANLSDSSMSLRDFFGDKFGIQFYYRHPRSYARRAVFSIDEPSPTIRGVNRPIPKGYPGHPGDPVPVKKGIRPLTTKERSLIQTFPECWDISGKKTEVEQIIGNAVPVKLGEFIGNCLINYIEQQEKMPSRKPKPRYHMPVYDKPNSVKHIQHAEQLLLFETGHLYLVHDHPITLLGTYRKTCRDWIVSKRLYNYPVTESELDTVKELLAVRNLILKRKGVKDLFFKVKGYSIIGKSDLLKLGYKTSKNHPAKQRYILYKLSPLSKALPCDETNAIPIVGKGVSVPQKNAASEIARKPTLRKPPKASSNKRAI
ncbi:MAG: DNA cytosine methyltransferase [Kiritimatiellae bacterium]|nr:DNA cytosine methyltransferase [Kiritimatiellia bacterium]